jgi:hypothetical protein
VAEEGHYIIAIDRNWSLEDLYRFPRAYEQVYFLLYSLYEELEEQDFERITWIFSIFPWQGGYSAVSFYNQLKFIVPKRDRPTIASIRYASPGWIELVLVVAIAYQIERIVKSTAASIETLNALYGKIIKGMQDRKLMRIKVAREALRLHKEEAAFVESCARDNGTCAWIQKPERHQ